MFVPSDSAALFVKACEQGRSRRPAHSRLCVRARYDGPPITAAVRGFSITRAFATQRFQTLRPSRKQELDAALDADDVASSFRKGSGETPENVREEAQEIHDAIDRSFEQLVLRVQKGNIRPGSQAMEVATARPMTDFVLLGRGSPRYFYCPPPPASDDGMVDLVYRDLIKGVLIPSSSQANLRTPVYGRVPILRGLVRYQELHPDLSDGMLITVTKGRWLGTESGGLTNDLVRHSTRIAALIGEHSPAQSDRQEAASAARELQSRGINAGVISQHVDRFVILTKGWKPEVAFRFDHDMHDDQRPMDSYIIRRIPVDLLPPWADLSIKDSPISKAVVRTLPQLHYSH